MDEVKAWLKKAKRDLEAAKSNFQQGFYDISAFLLQQALEKALKALYTKKFKQLIKTHNLIFLAKKLNLPTKFITTSRKVNPFYIESRYPPLFVAEKYTKTKISKLIEEAEVMVKWIEENL
jgi:HEPN domain-containing protein